MKYHNGKLRNELDSTLCLRLKSKKREMTFEEYLPIVVLCILLATLLLNGWLG